MPASVCDRAVRGGDDGPPVDCRAVAVDDGLAEAALGAPARRTPRPRTRAVPAGRETGGSRRWRPLRTARRSRRRLRPATRAPRRRPSVGRSVPRRLLRHLDRAALADDDHLHLARVLELILDLAGDLVREEHGAVVVDLGRLDDDADLAARLERVRLRHAGLRGRDLLERLEPADVVLEALPARARAARPRSRRRRSGARPRRSAAAPRSGAPRSRGRRRPTRRSGARAAPR